MSEHNHICATCGKQFAHADEDCEAFFFGACADCLKSEGEHE